MKNTRTPLRELTFIEKFRLLCELDDISYGFAQAASFKLLSQEDYNDIHELLDCICTTSLEKLILAIEQTKREYAEIKQSAKSQAERENKKQENNQQNENHQEVSEQLINEYISKQLKSLSDDAKFRFKLFFLIESIKQLQSLVVEADVISRKQIDQVWQQKNPFSDAAFTKKEGSVSKVDVFTGIYRVEDIGIIFEALQNHFKDATFPISLILSNCSQSLMIGYDHDKGFIYCDFEPTAELTNNLKVTHSVEDVAYAIANYFSGKNINTLSMSVYSMAEHLIECQQRLKQVRETQNWKQGNEISNKKAQQIDSYGASWLYIAARENEKDTVKSLLKAGSNPNKKVNTMTINGVTPLFIAAQNGCTEIIKDLIDHNAKINETVNGLTPLLMALLMEHPDTAQIFIDKGADINLADEAGLTPLMVASQKGYDSIVKSMILKEINLNKTSIDGKTALLHALYSKQENIAKMLIEAGAELSSADGQTPLHIAAEYNYSGVIEEIIKCGAELNKTSKGRTPLLIALMMDHPDAAKKLIDNGADVNLGDRTGVTPLMVAAAKGYDHIVGLIANKENVNATSTSGMNALLHALFSKQANTAKLLIDKGANVSSSNDDGMSPLHLAAQNGFTDIVMMALERNNNVDTKTITSITPLQLAASNQHCEVVKILLKQGANPNLLNQLLQSPLILACENDQGGSNKLIIEALINSKADVNQIDKRGASPLILVSANGDAEMVVLMIAKRASVNHASKDGISPLWAAVNANHVEVVKRLIDKGADATHVDGRGLSPLCVAAAGGYTEIFKILLPKYTGDDYLAARNAALLNACECNHPEIVELLLSEKAYTHATDRKSALNFAAKNGYEKIVNMLITYAVPVDSIINGVTPLLLSVENKKIEVVNTLLKTNAHIDISNEVNGDTALHIASRNGSVDIIKLLFEKHPNLNEKNHIGDTALSVACKGNFPEIVQLLLDAGADPRRPNAQGLSPLLLALTYGNNEIITIFLKHDALNLINESNNIDLKSALNYACKMGSIEIVKAILERFPYLKDEKFAGTFPLIVAIEAHQDQVIEYLLEEANANCNVVNDRGVTPLLAAIQEEINLDVITQLVDENTDVNQVDNTGISPLCAAIENEVTEVVEWLLGNGAIADSFDVNNQTPLMIATGKNNLDIVQALISAGANPSNQDQSDMTALHIAAMNGSIDIMKKLLSIETNVDPVCERKTPLIIAAELGCDDIVLSLIDSKNNNKADVNKEISGKTPLLVAIQKGHANVVEVLLENGAKLDTRINGKTIYDIANENADEDVLAAIKNYVLSREENTSKASKKENAKPSPGKNNENTFFNPARSGTQNSNYERRSNPKVINQ